jgi:hypothetical protein
MRIASRFMPKYKPKHVGIGAWTLLATTFAGIVYAAASAPIGTAVVVLLLCVCLLLSNRAAKREEDKLRHLAQARAGESICEFARDFDTREVDTWIVRAVYEQIQCQLKHVHAAFPLRASDRLKEDLHLDDDDLDMDVVVQIEQRTGRSLDGASSNRYFGKVKTVRDLVLFFHSQAKRSAA